MIITFPSSEWGGPVPSDPGLAAWAASMRSDGYAPATIRIRLMTVQVFARAAGVQPAALSVEHVRARLAESSYSAWTRRKYLEHLAAWGRWAGTEPTAGIRRPPMPRSVPRPIDEATLALLLVTAEEPLRTVILLGAYCGLRASEAAACRGSHLEHTPVGAMLRVRGKGGVEAVVPAPDIVVAALVRNGRGPVVPWRPQILSQRFSRHAARHGLVGLRFHQLRHRYGTAVYGASRDILITQQVMRHASPATTAGYAAIANGAAAAVVAQLPGAAGGAVLRSV